MKTLAVDSYNCHTTELHRHQAGIAHYLKYLALSPPKHTHIQINQIAATFDTAVSGYRVSQGARDHMQSINDAVAFVQTTVCMYVCNTMCT